MWFNVSFAKIRIIKLLVRNSAITEVNELKITVFKFTFEILQMQIFDIFNLKSKWKNQIDFKINVKMTAWERFV